jgi:hypothetical protein
MAHTGTHHPRRQSMRRRLLTARFTVRVRAPDPVLNADSSEYSPGGTPKPHPRTFADGAAEFDAAEAFDLKR